MSTVLKSNSNTKFPYTSNASLKVRYMAASLFDDGISRSKIAITLNVSRRLVNEWITMYLSGGIDALAIKKSPGRPPKLSIQEKDLLKDFVIKNSAKAEGGRLVGEDILRYIEDSFDVTYGLRNVYRLMAELNLSWITSRSKHPNQSQEAQETFKKFPVQYDHQNPGACNTK